MSQGVLEEQEIQTLCPTASYPEEPSPANLPEDTARVVETLTTRVDTTIFRLLVTARSTQDFNELRNDSFRRFVDLSTTIQTLLREMDGYEEPDVEASFAATRAYLDRDRWFLASDDTHREALFCLDTLHRAHLLIQDVMAYASMRKLSDDYLKPFQMAIWQEWWSILHLRCLLFAMRHQIRPTEEVFTCLLEGFRHSVMSYAYARTAVNSKRQHDYSQVDLEGIARESALDYSGQLEV